MMHRTRRWVIYPVATAEELATMLAQRSWTLCSGFYLAGHPEYFLLNDATSEDGAGEFGVVKAISLGAWTQIESITFSWCDVPQAAEHIRRIIAGEYDASAFALSLDLTGRLDTANQQHRCHLCA